MSPLFHLEAAPDGGNWRCDLRFLFSTMSPLLIFGDFATDYGFRGPLSGVADAQIDPASALPRPSARKEADGGTSPARSPRKPVSTAPARFTGSTRQG